ncbi:MAG: hypothetical protein HY568_00640 [Candidatus Latescibacteria bacterium]|nr:hypothetical protein [Candidatus Latescibacterota bacterium]
MKAFRGYLKASPDYSPTNKIWRLYLTLDFDDYIEFNEDQDYIASVPLETPQNPVAGTLVWIKATSELRRVSTASRRGQVDFLRGKLRSEHQSRTGIEAIGGEIFPKKRPPETGDYCTEVTFCNC